MHQADRDEGGSRRPRTHLIAVDGSRYSQLAFRWAHRYLPKEDRFLLFNGLPHVPYVEGPLETVDLDARERLLSRLKLEQSQMMERYRNQCIALDRECILNASDDEFATASTLGRAICDLSKRTHAASVICGSRGLSGVTSFFLGSVSSKIVNSCEGTVVVVKGSMPEEH